MTSTNDTKHTIALVTGANRGLGLAFVEELLAKGAAKVYAATRKPNKFDDPRVVNIMLDLTDPASIKEVAKLAPDTTLVINNAGIFLHSTVINAPIDDVRLEFETHVFGPLQLIQAMAPILKANGGGAIININSALSWLPGSSYGASKAALLAITNTIRLELAPQGTQVISVHSGLIDTDMVRALDLPKHSPKDIAQAALDALKKGKSEVLADDMTRHAKSLASSPVEALQTPQVLE